MLPVQVSNEGMQGSIVCRRKMSQQVSYLEDDSVEFDAKVR